MLRVRDIMSADVVSVPPDTTLREAMNLFTSRHISGAPVVRGGRTVGVVSLTDLAEFAANSPGVPRSSLDPEDADEWHNVGDIAGSDVPPDEYFAHVWEESDDEAARRMADHDVEAGDVLETHTVSEVMNRTLLALPPDAPVDYAAAVMRRAGVHRVLVMEGRLLLGVLTTSDIANAVADHRLTSRVYVFGARAAARGA